MTTWTKKPSWSTVDNEEEELHWVQDNNNCPVMYVYLYVCMYVHMYQMRSLRQGLCLGSKNQAELLILISKTPLIIRNFQNLYHVQGLRSRVIKVSSHRAIVLGGNKYNYGCFLIRNIKELSQFQIKFGKTSFLVLQILQNGPTLTSVQKFGHF